MDRRRADRARRSSALGAWRWIAAVLFVACVDGPTSPGRFAELRIRPSYADADDPTALGLVVDSARVRIARASSPATFLVDSMVAYSSDTASLGWLLDLLDEQETMRVDVTIWDDGAQLYSGEREVQVSEGSIGGDATQLPVLYVGPPIVATVTATPADVVLDALGATVTLAAEARDRHDQVITTAFSWTSADESVARVDPATGVVTAVRNGTTTVQVSAGGKQGTATVVVNQRVASVAVTPQMTKLSALGATLLLSASAKDSRGSIVEGTTFAWSSSNPSIASVDAASGEVTAVSGGSVAITAKGGDVTGSAKVTVNPTQNVASVVVSPGSATLTAVGATQQLTAVARDANGDVVTGVQFEWASSADNIATVDPESGVVQAVAHGTSTVTATAGAIAGSATLTVSLTTHIATIVVSPGAFTLTAVGAVQQFTAVARDANGNVLTGVPFDWASGADNVATVDPTGLVQAAGHGVTSVTASANSILGTAELTVNLGTSIETVVVTPGTTTFTAVGAAQQFTAEARDASGAVVPVTAFEWASSAADVATVNPTTGLATTVAQGTTTISARVGTATGTATLEVNLTSSVATIAVAPGASTLTAVGATQQFSAVARDANGSVLPGVQFHWASNADNVATVDPASGLAHAIGHGATTVTATAGTIVGSAALSVDLSEVFASIEVTPGATTLIAVGAVQQFTAVMRDASGNVVTGVQFAWTSSVPDVAAVNPNTGLATAATQGTATISATAGSITGTASLGVDLTPSVASIVVAPGTSTLTAVGATQQFTAVARDAHGNVLPGVQFDWTSGADVATIDRATGLATALAHGATTVTATAGTIVGSAALSVDLSEVFASIEVTPGATTLTAVGAVQQFTAVMRDASGNVLTGVQFAWTSSAPDVATVNPTTGLGTAATQGATTISATAGSVTGTASLGVDLTPSVASIVVSPSNASLTALGASQQFTAVARDANNNVLPGVPFDWTSSAHEVASVNPTTGLATAAAQGTTTIGASVGSVTGTASLEVNLTPSVASIIVTPGAATLTAIGATQQYDAEARDASGALLPGVQFSWTTGSTEVASIDPVTGVASAVRHGATTVTATAGSIAGSATLAVDLSLSIATVVVTPGTTTLTAVGAEQQFTAEARDASGVVVPVAAFAWSALTPVATIDPVTGLATAAAHGTTTIVASVAGVSGNATLMVDLTARVASIVVTPAPFTLTAVGATVQFTAEARDVDGAPLPGVPVSWSSSATNVATIDPATGLATAVTHGATTIVATSGDVTGTAPLTVDLSSSVMTIVVSPATATLTQLSAKQQFMAVAHDASGAVVPGMLFAWSSSIPTVAWIDPITGRAISQSNGVTTITASAAGVSGTATLTVQVP